MKREKCFKPEEPETILITRFEFATLLKLYAENKFEDDLTKLETEAFLGILEKLVDAYNGTSINEAYTYFHGKVL